MIASLYYESIIYALFEYAQIDDWEFSGGAIECSCNANLPPIWFQFDGAWIEARPEDYMFDYYGTGDTCILFILPTGMPMHILGMPVFVDYYSIHEPLTGQVHWAPHTNSPKDTVVTGPIPTGQFLALGAVQQQSAFGDLAEYALAAAACYAAIYYFQTDIYLQLTATDSGYTQDQVYGLSGAYFLGVALVYYFAIEPVAAQIVGTASGTSASSLKVSSGSTTALSKATWAILALGTLYMVVRYLKAKKVAAAAVEEKKEKSNEDLNQLLNQHLNRLE